MMIRLILSAFAISLGLFTTLSCTPSDIKYRGFCDVLREYEAAYPANEMVAQKTFNGTPVKVTGSIADIEDDEYTGMHTISLTNIGCQSNIYELDKLDCMWNKTYVSEMLTLRKGQTITLKGTFQGGRGHGGVIWLYWLIDAQIAGTSD